MWIDKQEKKGGKIKSYFVLGSAKPRAAIGARGGVHVMRLPRIRFVGHEQRTIIDSGNDRNRFYDLLRNLHRYYSPSRHSFRSGDVDFSFCRNKNRIDWYWISSIFGKQWTRYRFVAFLLSFLIFSFLTDIFDVHFMQSIKNYFRYS